MQPPDPLIWKALMVAIEADDPKAIADLRASVGGVFDAILTSHHPLDDIGRTPLMMAYWWGKSLASTALVNAGSNYRQEDAKGRGAVWYAQRFGNGRVQDGMNQLIEAGERRLSMEKIISRGAKSPVVAADEVPVPKRRRSQL